MTHSACNDRLCVILHCVCAMTHAELRFALTWPDVNLPVFHWRLQIFQAIKKFQHAFTSAVEPSRVSMHRGHCSWLHFFLLQNTTLWSSLLVLFHSWGCWSPKTSYSSFIRVSRQLHGNDIFFYRFLYFCRSSYNVFILDIFQPTSCSQVIFVIYWQAVMSPGCACSN